jgi:hypothetical protein
MLLNVVMKMVRPVPATLQHTIRLTGCTVTPKMRCLKVRQTERQTVVTARRPATPTEFYHAFP